MQPTISTRVIDTSLGLPAAGVFVVLERYQDTEHDWLTVGEVKTDAEGRATDVLNGAALANGLYRITFDTDAYFGDQEIETFYPSISINFQVLDESRPYHVPLLLSPFGYETFCIR